MLAVMKMASDLDLEKKNNIVTSWLQIIILVSGFWITIQQISNNTDAKATQAKLEVVKMADQFRRDSFDMRYRDFLHHTMMNMQMNSPAVDEATAKDWEKYYKSDICIQREYIDQYRKQEWFISSLSSYIELDLVDGKLAKELFCGVVAEFAYVHSPVIGRTKSKFGRDSSAVHLFEVCVKDGYHKGNADFTPHKLNQAISSVLKLMNEHPLNATDLSKDECRRNIEALVAGTAF